MAKSRQQVINVSIHSTVGPRPGVIDLAQRYLEKSKPEPVKVGGWTYIIPLDLLRIAGVTNDSLGLKGIKSMTLTYRRRT